MKVEGFFFALPGKCLDGGGWGNDDDGDHHNRRDGCSESEGCEKKGFELFPGKESYPLWTWCLRACFFLFMLEDQM